ncbi:proline racemase family protein [Chloroflexota bacterium]
MRVDHALSPFGVGPRYPYSLKPYLKGSFSSITKYAKGELPLGEVLVTESIIGSRFHAKAVKEVNVGSITAIIPEVTGRAFFTGMHTFVIDENDPFKYGFKL